MSDHAKEEKPNRYQEYLESKHAKFEVDPNLLENVVKKATKSNIGESERLIHGEVNEVYSVTTKSGDAVIVRVSRNEKPKFEAERWAIEQSKKAGVPVPEVLLLDSVEDSGEKLSFCVEKKIEGVSLKSLTDGGKTDIKPIVVEAGGVLARIHSVKTDGYGELKPEGKGSYDSWEEYMLAWNLKGREHIESSAKAIGLDVKAVRRAMGILEEHKSVFGNIGPHLLHSDYGGDHIFVKNGEISGIIDFENCRGGDIANDFSWWSFYGRNRPPIEWLEEGYKREGNFGDNYDLRLRLGKIKLGLDLVWYYQNENHQTGIDLVKRNLNEDVNSFK